MDAFYDFEDNANSSSVCKKFQSLTNTIVPISNAIHLLEQKKVRLIGFILSPVLSSMSAIPGGGRTHKSSAETRSAVLNSINNRWNGHNDLVPLKSDVAIFAWLVEPNTAPDGIIELCAICFL